MKIFVLLFFAICLYVNAENVAVSQPNLIFVYDKIKGKYDKLNRQIEFNRGVNFLENGNYQEAIEVFQKSIDFLKAPSLLNIGIAYYRLGNLQEAEKYLKQISIDKDLAISNLFSFMSSNYYLYKIKNEKKYLEDLVKATRNKNLRDNEKRMLIDSYIVLENYKGALAVLSDIPGTSFKQALIYIKLEDYEKANIFLNRAEAEAVKEDDADAILWFKIYKDLKTNDLKNLQNNLAILGEKDKSFYVNKILPYKLVFNQNKYASKDYFDFITKYSVNRQIDMVFYFAPFVFSDNEEINLNDAKSSFTSSKENMQNLEAMMEYNKTFIDLAKEDPIVRVKKLQDHLKNQKNAQSYVYYNLALSLAQISDYNSALEYFIKAYRLNPGNKLYGALSILCAKRQSREIKEIGYITANMNTQFGSYNYLGKSLYNIFINEGITPSEDKTENKDLILYSALEIFKKLKEGRRLNGEEKLFTKYHKDPLVNLMKMVIKAPNENQFTYVSKLQDTIPLNFNNSFLDASLVVTEFYIDILKALGLLNRANLNLNFNDNTSPSLLRTYAIERLYNGEPKVALKILEKIQKEYDLKDKYSYYLILASYLRDEQYNDALLQLSLIKAIMRDSNSGFLDGIVLINDMKVNSARQYFKHPFFDRIVDFELEGIDEFLKSL